MMQRVCMAVRHRAQPPTSCCMRQVTAKQNRAPSRCGYLYKYRPFATGLFSNTWELRFFTLNGTALQYYKSEKDTTLHPRGYVDVAVRTCAAALHSAASILDFMPSTAVCCLGVRLVSSMRMHACMHARGPAEPCS